MDSSFAIDRIVAFAEKIYRRADGLDDVVPANYSPNWSDKPSPFRLYPGIPSIRLPGITTLSRDYHRAIERAAQSTVVVPQLNDISMLLLLLTAPLSLRLDIDWNSDRTKIDFTNQSYRRGSSSGGGLYPTQIYLASEGGGNLPFGLYHYVCGHHSLIRIRNGQWQKNISAAALNNKDSKKFMYYLILSSDFWMNCFKYHNFGYHVCTHDIGSIIETIQIIMDSIGIKHQTFLSFDDDAMNSIIGATQPLEGVFAVIGLGPLNDAVSEHRATADPLSSHEALVVQPWQRSRAVEIPQELAQMHALTSLNSKSMTSLTKSHGKAPSISAPPIDKEPQKTNLADLVNRSLPQILAERRSGWGSLRGPSGVPVDKVLALLGFVQERIDCGATSIREAICADNLGLILQANSITGLERGAYRWNSRTKSLLPISSAPPRSWQSTYQMQNYNIDETPCVIFITGNLKKANATHGVRGYRILNAFVGLSIQAAYIGATALGLNCGTALGVKAQTVKSIIEIDDQDNILIAFYFGGPIPPAYLFDYRLVPDVPKWK